jgi:hypothetical protein
MSKLFVVPVEEIDEYEMFCSTVKNGIFLDELKPFLFPKLYELLKNTNGSARFPIWGVPSGVKSSDANKWNKIAEGDIAIFTRDNRFLGFSKIGTKFQSESIARKLWPKSENEAVKQYLFALKAFFEIDEVKSRALDAIRRKGKIDLKVFQVFDNQNSLEISRVLGIDVPETSQVVSSQGFGLSAAEKKIVELHAVKAAITHLSNLGFTEIEDVGSVSSFDLLARGPGRQLSVEVKGSTGPATSIILTKNEVSFQKEIYPLNGLFVLSNIQLDRNPTPVASGGEALFISPWLITESNLKPISFEYSV